DAAGVNALLMIRLDETCRVGHQAAGQSTLTLRIDRGDCVAVGERDNLIAPGSREGIGHDDQRVGPPLGETGRRRVDFACGTGPENKQLFPKPSPAAARAPRAATRLLCRRPIARARGSGTHCRSSGSWVALRLMCTRTVYAHFVRV